MKVVDNQKISVDSGADIYANDPWVHTGHQTDPMQRRMRGTTAATNASFDVAFMQQISDNLFVGGCTQGLVLPPFIKHVVSLYNWEEYKIEHEIESHLRIRMHDSLDQDVKNLDPLAHWINECRESGPVLVHCQAGLNRSPLVVARVLYHNDDNFDVDGDTVFNDANPVGKAILSFLREVRGPAVLCNKAFEQEVLSWVI